MHACTFLESNARWASAQSKGWRTILGTQKVKSTLTRWCVPLKAPCQRIILTHVSDESVHKSLNRTVAIGHQNWWKHIPKYQPKIEMMEGTGGGSFSFVLKLLTSASRLFSSTGYPTKAQLPHLRRRCLIHLRCANFVLILTTWCETGKHQKPAAAGKTWIFWPSLPSVKKKLR